MKAALVALALLPAVAHADPLTAVASAGHGEGNLIARGKVSVVLVDRSEYEGETLLVDRRGRVLEAGPIVLDVAGTVRVELHGFFGDPRLLDVVVSWTSSSEHGEYHYVVRSAGFTLACAFDGDGATITKTRARPLEWRVTRVGVDSFGMPFVGAVDFHLGGSGACARF